MHFDFHQAVTGAGFTAAALHIEGETAGAVATNFRIGSGCKEVADVIKEAGVGGRVASGGSADGALVNVDDLVQPLHTLHTAAFAGTGPGVIQLAQEGLVQHLIDQAGLTGTGHARNAGKGSQRNFHIHVLQIIFLRAEDLQALAVALPALARNRNLLGTGKVLACNGLGIVQNVFQGTGFHDLATVAACTGTNVHDEVRSTHGILVMFHHDEGVAQISQMLQGTQQFVIIPLVQADGRLVQNIQHTHEGRTDLGGQTDSLALAAGKGSGRT